MTGQPVFSPSADQGIFTTKTEGCYVLFTLCLNPTYPPSPTAPSDIIKPQSTNLTFSSKDCVVECVLCSTLLLFLYSLRDNGIGDEGTTALADTLRVNQNLKTLK